MSKQNEIENKPQPTEVETAQPKVEDSKKEAAKYIKQHFIVEMENKMKDIEKWSLEITRKDKTKMVLKGNEDGFEKMEGETIHDALVYMIVSHYIHRALDEVIENHIVENMDKPVA
jgi:16S rRNA U1498 N3-methylase RsmE